VLLAYRPANPYLNKRILQPASPLTANNHESSQMNEGANGRDCGL